MLVGYWHPEGFHHPVLLKEPVMGPWGCPSPQGEVSRGGFLGVQIPSHPLLMSPLPVPHPRPYGKNVPRLNYWLTYEGIMKKHGGRPHWAKVPVALLFWEKAMCGMGPLPLLHCIEGGVCG